MIRQFLAIALVLGACHTAVTQTNDTLTLNTGAKIEGRFVEKEIDGKRYVIIELDNGVKMKVRRSAVSQLKKSSDLLVEYQAQKKAATKDVAGHWKMAVWCKENLEKGRSATGRKLSPQREFHLQSIIRLDPNHGDARRLLGHTLLNGQWIHREHPPSQYGMVKIGSRWYTEEELLIEKMKEKSSDRYDKWKTELRKQRGRTNRANEYLNTLSTVNDRFAVPGLIDRFNTEKNAALKMRTLEAIGRQDSRLARQFLVNTAITSPNEIIRERASSLLNGRQFSKDSAARHAAAILLKAKDNPTVLRAGALLGQLKSESAIWPLIQSLKTTHEFVIPGNNGRIGANFNSGGAGGLTTGGKAKKVKKTLQNSTVEESLRIITGQNFGFNEIAWRNWYVQKYSVGYTDLRRNEKRNLRQSK